MGFTTKKKDVDVERASKNSAGSGRSACRINELLHHRGLGNVATVKELRESAKKFVPAVLCVLET